MDFIEENERLRSELEKTQEAYANASQLLNAAQFSVKALEQKVEELEKTNNEMLDAALSSSMRQMPMVPLPQNEITISLFDGGGIDVTMGNYRPLGIHVRAVESRWVGEVVGGIAGALVSEWVARQRTEGRIREI